VKARNPRLVYASITGYGTEGPWRDKPGQDLLAQAVSGLTWLTGDAQQGPVPMGLSVADMFAAAHAVQGILACLVRRGVNGQGGHVEVSLLESILDFQFEVITTHLNDGGRVPQRSSVRNAHAYLGAPYGIYETSDGYIAIAMGSVPRLGELLGCPALCAYIEPGVGLNATRSKRNFPTT
jgi:crotonobetainyl-CoA:carnitine CoA-transferase CaiB-like acyl-CoA transferase